MTFWHVPTGSYLALALVALIGALANLAAAVSSDSWTAGGFELFGSTLLCTVLGIDVYSVITTTRYPDTDVVAGLLTGLAMGLLFRVCMIARDAFVVVKDQRAPPVGDLDLLVAGRMDSATAVAIGAESLGAHAAELKAAERKEAKS
jgi:hypothetical protein